MQPGSGRECACQSSGDTKEARGEMCVLGVEPQDEARRGKLFSQEGKCSSALWFSEQECGCLKTPLAKEQRWEGRVRRRRKEREEGREIPQGLREAALRCRGPWLRPTPGFHPSPYLSLWGRKPATRLPWLTTSCPPMPHTLLAGDNQTPP